MDEIDRRVLLALQRDASIAIATLAAEVGLPQTPCWKRVQKLERSGVILGRGALIKPEKVGLGLTIFVQVETRDHSADWLDDFARAVLDIQKW